MPFLTSPKSLWHWCPALHYLLCLKSGGEITEQNPSSEIRRDILGSMDCQELDEVLSTSTVETQKENGEKYPLSVLYQLLSRLHRSKNFSNQQTGYQQAVGNWHTKAAMEPFNAISFTTGLYCCLREGTEHCSLCFSDFKCTIRSGHVYLYMHWKSF